MDKNFVPAAQAYKKLKIAHELATSVYIYGATGFGKTRLVREFLDTENYLWISALDENPDLYALEQRIEQEAPSCLVIDDLQFIRDESSRKYISHIARRDDIWLILIGRMTPQQWLAPLIADFRIIVISENDLNYTTEDTLSLAAMEGLELSDQEAEKITKINYYNIYGISLTLQLIRSGYTYGPDLQKKITDLYLKHLEENVVSMWSKSLQEFLMQMSVVDSFTLPMAVMITGDDQAAELIQEAFEIGNFISVKGDTYYLRSHLIFALKNRALKVFGLGKYRQYLSNAGLYYEIHGDLLNALQIYEECDNKEKIRSVLIKNGKRHPAANNYYELRKYYLNLREEEITGCIPLMTTMSLLYSIILDIDKSEYWYQKLKEYAYTVKGREKKDADAHLIYLDIALPHRGSEDIIDIAAETATGSSLRTPGLTAETATGSFLHKLNQLKVLSCSVTGGRAAMPEFSLTNNQPSIMNGDKDFCHWSKNDLLLANTIGKPLEQLLGKTGHGLTHLALAESFYEKGRPVNEVLDHLIQSRMEIEIDAMETMLFVNIGLQIKLNVVKGNLDYAFELLDSFENRIKKKGSGPVLKMVRAFGCQLSLYNSDDQAVNAWLNDEAPDENMEFCSPERFRYLVKARVYMQLGKNEEAAYLLKLLRNYSLRYKRNYIHMETGLLLAIVKYRMNEDWKDIFTESLKEAEEFGFIRIISTEGAAILPLMKNIRKEYTKEGPSNEEKSAQAGLPSGGEKSDREGLASDREKSAQAGLPSGGEKSDREGLASDKEKSAQAGLPSGKTGPDRQWFNHVMEETSRIASYFPAYLSHSIQKIQFSPRSLEVLKLQSQGKSVREIAQILYISERTVKYHSSENYRKLGAKGKTDAVQIAKSLHLL